MIKISVIVPVYKAEKYIHQCINSILDQSFTDFELILVDDGSPDNSGRICDEYASKDNRIRVFHKENGGVSSARNVGINNAVGEYITFIDSDDWISNDFFSNAINACIENNLDIFLSGYNRFNDDNAIVSSSHIDETIYVFNRALEEKEYYFLLKSNYIAGPCCKLFRKSIVGDTRFDTSMCFGEDLKFVFTVLKNAKTIKAVTNCYYFYRFTPGSLVSSYSVAKLESVRKTYVFLLDYCKELSLCTNNSFYSFVQERMIGDYSYTIMAIFSSKVSLYQKYKLISILYKQKQIRSIIRRHHNKAISFTPGFTMIKHYYYAIINRLSKAEKNTQ